MSRPTVVVALHDGFFGCGTGAGRSNQALLATLTAVLPTTVRLVVLPVHLRRDSPEYDPGWHAQTSALLAHRVADRGAVVHPVDNGTNGLVRFGGLSCFRHLGHHTAAVLTHQILPDADPVLMLGLDVPFLGLAALLPTDVLPNLVLVPRSSALLHAPDDHERITWEANSLHTAAQNGGRIAAISSYMRRHLRIGYHVPEHALVDLPNGLIHADWHLTPPPFESELLPAPARRGFLFSMGRAQPCKGFDDLLDALVLLHKEGIMVPHLLLAAVTDQPEPNDYQQHLARRITQTTLDVTLLTRFQPGLRRLLAHPALRGVVVPSRAEPFGRIPMESYAAGATPVVATTAGGLTEQVIDRHTGFTASPADPSSLATALRKALALTPAERTRMRDNARRFAATHYNYPRTVLAFLGHVALWLPECPSTLQ